MSDEPIGRPEDLDPLEDREPGDPSADEWERLIAAFRTAAPRGTAPPWLEQRVMAEIEALQSRSVWQRALGWLIRPAPVRVSPLAAGLVTATAAAVLLLVGRATPSPEVASNASAPTEPAETVVYVQFVLEAPTATSVAVAGDFSDWQPSFTLTDSDGDGVWTGRVPVSPGVHGYMFLIDETSWQTDPNAERYQDDGFGNRNAVLAVGASG